MLKIVSGGQTGVDRAALDAAMRVGIACGGWVPQGRKAEDGLIAPRYPVIELPGGDYPQRTERNVQDSAGTAIIYFGSISGGTLHTLQSCRIEDKPHLLIDARTVTAQAAAQRIAAFYRALQEGDLNIAGPRSSEAPLAYSYTLEAVTEFLQLHCVSPGCRGGTS